MLDNETKTVCVTCGSIVMIFDVPWFATDRGIMHKANKYLPGLADSETSIKTLKNYKDFGLL